MALPNVDITLGNGALGAVSAGADGVAALVLTGTGTLAMPLGTPKVVYSLADAVGLGITATDQPAAYRHIKEFYDGYRFISGSDTAELYVIMLTDTVTMATACDVNTAVGAKSLLEYSKGRARLLGVTRKPGVGYTPDLDDGIDADSIAALAKAQDLANYFAEKQAPLRVLIEARSFALANVGDLADLKTMSFNRAGLVIWSTLPDGSASVGYTLGVKAALPVQRKISRVKNGAYTFPSVYIGSALLEDVAGIGAIHNKGYIAMRTYPNRPGVYFTGEPMACHESDDYAILSRGLVIDKAQRIAYDVFLQEVEEDVQVDDQGQLLQGYKMYLENNVVSALSLQMAGNISGSPSFRIPDGQNPLSDATTKVVLKVTPVGYQSQIDVLLGFQNPALN